MTKREFFRLLSAHYATHESMSKAIKDMRAAGWIQDELCLTAAGIAKLNSVKKDAS